MFIFSVSSENGRKRGRNVPENGPPAAFFTAARSVRRTGLAVSALQKAAFHGLKGGISEGKRMPFGT